MESMTALPPIHELYRTHRQRALAIVSRIVKDRDEAEDVVQDVFAKLSLTTFRFDGKAAAATWLHRILVNTSINALRAKKRRGKLETPSTEPSSPEDDALDQERHRRFLEALTMLSEQHRLIVTLRDLRGYSYPEIADMLGIPEGTVKSALNRGRAHVMRVMAASYEVESTCAAEPA